MRMGDCVGVYFMGCVMEALESPGDPGDPPSRVYNDGAEREEVVGDQLPTPPQGSLSAIFCEC